MKKVVLYARVSTEKQEEEKTIESQLADLRKICKDFQIFKEYIDDGWSGETLDRPALDQLREDASKGLFEAVYVHSVDRLSRNLYRQGIAVEDLKKKGIELFVGDKPISDTPEGKFMFNMLGAAAEYEKEKILERTKRGRLYKAINKGIVGAIAHYGCVYIKKTSDKEGYYKINGKEAKIVNLIFDLYIRYNSINAVVKELTLQNIKPQRGGEKWSRSTIRQILRNEAYIGTGYYGKHYGVESDKNGKKYKRKVKNSRRNKAKTEWIPLKFPIILKDKKKFETAQKLLAKNYKPYAKTKYFYLLSGLIRCKNCNSTFTGETKNNGFSYYRCNRRHKKHPLPNDCNAKPVHTEILDIPIWKNIFEVITSPNILTNHIEHLANNISESKTALEEGKKDLLMEIEELNKKKDRILEIYTDGAIGKEQFLKKMKDYEERQKELKGKIEEIDIKLTQIIDKPAILEHIETFCKLAKEKINDLAPEQKRSFLQYLIEVIKFDQQGGKAMIIGHIPTENETSIPLPQKGTEIISLKA